MLFSRNLLDLNLLGAIPDSFGNVSSNAPLPYLVWVFACLHLADGFDTRLNET